MIMLDIKVKTILVVRNIRSSFVCCRICMLAWCLICSYMLGYLQSEECSCICCNINGVWLKLNSAVNWVESEALIIQVMKKFLRKTGN